MPPEWGPHQATIMEWPARRDLWGDLWERALSDYATVANSVAEFEPVLMVADPSVSSEARSRCGGRVDILEMPTDDSWARDNGPIFVTDASGRVAIVHFGFNGWGGKYAPWDKDADVPRRLAEHFGMRRYVAPMVLEGGSFFLDGDGTLLTTEQCLLHPNRNPSMTREEIERLLGEYLGVQALIWLGRGHPLDRDTDGHVDAIAQYVEPGRILHWTPADPQDAYHVEGQANLERLRASSDAKQRSIEVIEFDPGTPTSTAYANCYLVNGGLIVPADGEPTDEAALEQLAKAFPDREVVTVPGETLLAGGGGPHCITQQIPAGDPLS